MPSNDERRTAGEYDPDTLEIESELRESLRDILRATPDVRDAALLDEVRKLKKFHTDKTAPPESHGSARLERD